LLRKALETHAIVFADGALELLAQEVGQTFPPERDKRRAFFQWGWANSALKARRYTSRK
jgi:hypothetical protein